MSSIHQEVTFPGAVSGVYEALTKANLFSRVTGGAEAEISEKEGGSFSCFGGRIVGRQVELVEGRRIVQAWRASDWKEGVYSVVRFELEKSDDGTRLVFDQSGFPPEEREHLEQGWKAMYWEPLRKFLG